MSETYDYIFDAVTKVMARRVDKDHGDMLRDADGYMTAWFMYYLQGDQYAGTAFFGESAEILSNSNWQDTIKTKTSLIQSNIPYNYIKISDFKNIKPILI